MAQYFYEAFIDLLKQPWEISAEFSLSEQRFQFALAGA